MLVLDRIEFDCSFDLAERIENLLEDIDDDYPLISVYGKYGVIRELLEDLIAYGGFSIADEIELECYDISHYDKEFVLYVGQDGVNIEKTFRNNTYYYGGGNISFVHEDCSSTLLKYIDSDKTYEFGYSEDDDDEGCDYECCCDCCGSAVKPECDDLDTSTSESTYVSRKKDGTPTGFQKSWFTDEDGVSCYSSYTHYSNDVGMLREIAEKFGVKL